MKNPLSTTLYYVTFNMETETDEKKLIYNEIPKQVIDQFQTEFDHISRKDFNKYVL